jgi:hypothetical protein
MRKIERDMIQAIIDRRDWRNANTEVRITDEPDGKTALVLLHGNPIAQYGPNGSMSVRHAGWRTNTTKSRLNAFLTTLGRHSYGVYQKAYAWYLCDDTGERDMFQDHWYTIA